MISISFAYSSKGCEEGMQSDIGETPTSTRWKRGCIGTLTVAAAALPFATALTLHLQLTGSIVGFFLAGAFGGCFVAFDRAMGLYVSIIGSTMAYAFGMLFLTGIVPELLQFSALRYLGSYVLWLTFGMSVNLFPIMVTVAGAGGVFGSFVSSRFALPLLG